MPKCHFTRRQPVREHQVGIIGRGGWGWVGGDQHKCKDATLEHMRRKLEERKTANATNKRK